MKEILLTQGKVALVDDDDFEWLNQFNWLLSKRPNTSYAIRNYKKNNGKWSIMYMHRETMNVKNELEIDHKDKNGLNNQKANLRIATHSENMMNRKIQINNTLGYKGVYYNKRYKKYIGQIKLNNKSIYLGGYSTPEKAAKAYNIAALKYHKDFARLNII